MSTDFNSIANSIIPYIILIVAVFILYRPLKEPLSELWGLIARIFPKKEDKDENESLFKKKLQEIEFS